jgi:hypothetical protein
MLSMERSELSLQELWWRLVAAPPPPTAQLDARPSSEKSPATKIAKLLLCNFDKQCKENPIYMYVLLSVLGIRIRIRRIGMFLGLPDPDLLVRGYGSGSFPFLIDVLSGLK